MKVCSTIKDILTGAEATYGANDAIRYKIGKNAIESKNYTELKHDSESFSRALDSLGIIGEHIALAGATSYTWMVSYLGIVNSGGVAVPLSISLPTEEFCELVDRSDAVALVLDEMRADIADVVKAQCPKLKYLISMQKEESDSVSLSFMELIRKNSGSYDREIRPDMLCTIIFTSGTTGKSKGVMLTHRNLAENATCLEPEMKPRTVTLSVLPNHHAFCLTSEFLRGLFQGVVICINDSLHRMAKNIKLFKPNVMLMVPLMIESFAKKLEDIADVSPEYVKKEIFGEQFHTIYSGGAYLNSEYYDLFEKYGIKLLHGYGMTECSPTISMSLRWTCKRGAVGRIIPNCEAKVVDEELWVRGSSVMQGYYKMPEETAETLQDGWLKTGDLGFVDEEGFVYLTGRKKNLIITRNGENVSPEEIENKLGEARLVQEVLVREKEGVIEAEIFPDYEYAKNYKIDNIRAELQQIVDRYNKKEQSFKKVYSLNVRETEFPKNATKKIVRF